MRILFPASEVVPFSKTGGLADVAGALPSRLNAAGHDVLTVTPLHAQIDREEHQLEPIATEAELELLLGEHRWTYRIWRHRPTNTLFIDLPDLFHRDALYSDAEDEHRRFAAFSRAALDVCRHLDWRPDVVHCHDWQTGLIPLYLRATDPADPHLGGVPSILTIHNLGYQGRFTAAVVADLGLEELSHLFHQDHLAEGYVGFLETGILHSNLITTVSPTYAREITTPEGGAGLDPLLRRRRTDLVGILNGIDTTEWNPLTDPYIPWRYSVKSLWRKERDKQSLVEGLGLPYRRGVPVAGMISRLVYQKGIDIMAAPLTHFLETWDMRLVVLGSGEAEYERLFFGLAAAYPDKVSFTHGYDLPLSHLIEAGSDIFLMPSRYEPCGLNQMYSLAYGTAPVVRRVGGLADTVQHVHPTAGVGNGFVFDHYSEDGLGWALGQALTLHTNPKSWRILQHNAMAEDNSWERRAGDYAALYARAVRG